jgi:hypothetical protein
MIGYARIWLFLAPIKLLNRIFELSNTGKLSCLIFAFVFLGKFLFQSKSKYNQHHLTYLR